jgi:hypothetical protein
LVNKRNLRDFSNFKMLIKVHSMTTGYATRRLYDQMKETWSIKKSKDAYLLP